MQITKEKLANFLVRAKVAAYAGDGKELEPERKDFKELEYTEGDLYYRDSYVGAYRAPGQEVVRESGKPIWIMSYDGGMVEKYYGDKETESQAIVVLKEALKAVTPDIPYRGPKELVKEDWRYVNEIEGDIKGFKGNEKIFHGDELVFEQNYIGGLVVGK